MRTARNSRSPLLRKDKDMFKKAVPVFAKGKTEELNYQLILRSEAESLKDTVLYITAFSFYRLVVNGKFVAFGPARTAKGYGRVDEIALEKYNIPGVKNEIIIEVAGYYCRSLSTEHQPSFAIAELRRGDEVILATGTDFEGYRSCRRLQNVERYSAQRHFGEVWDYSEDDMFAPQYRVELERCGEGVKFLPRRAPYATYEELWAEGFSSRGYFRFDETRPYRLTRSSFTIDDHWGRYTEDEVDAHPYRWLQRQKQICVSGRGDLPVQIGAGEYVILDLKKIKVGFIEWSARAQEDCDIVMGFSELCSPNEFEFTNINSQNVIEYFIPEGKEVDTMSFEPYTCRVAIIMVKKGSMVLSSFGIRKFEYDMTKLIKREISDPQLARIYEAAENSFAHNAVDIYTDCPSRERAGWLCDSFFTGRAEYFLTGKTLVEDAFLENYRLYTNDGNIPVGILPMCYPGDYNGNFIPQWNMWYIIEVKEYLTERNTSVDKELFRESIYGILRWLEKFENGDGLLQGVEGWNFVEWSTANEWVQDVNYPTNFLYSRVLESAGELYGDAELSKKAVKVRDAARELGFDGEIFVDNATVGEDGKLHNTKNSSEACQYYAILFGGVDLSLPKYAKLRSYVFDSFASLNKEGRGFVPVNAFIGLYLRIYALMELGEKELLANDIKSFFGGMVASTGTLWEYKQHKGSYDHGFTSFSALAIDYVDNKNG